MEAIWKPVAADEGFEIVRRRLFLNCKDEAGRDAVCQAFSQMYQENSSDFPANVKEVDYLQRMRSCYPIHPEVFDRLYEDWATIERFQKTRGVLRLMAAVVHNLWMNQDGSLLIMPGSLSLDVSTIRDELTRHVGDNWNAIVDHEVDGKNSIPYQKDQEILVLGTSWQPGASRGPLCWVAHRAPGRIPSAVWRLPVSVWGVCSPGKTLQRSTMR